MVAPPLVNPADAARPDTGATVPASPSPRRTRRPRWLDVRLVLGIALVLGSVLLGAVVVSRAQSSTSVWSLRHDLAAGTVLSADDLAAVDVRLGGSSDRYVTADRAVVGSRLGVDVGAGELLPRAASVATAPAWSRSRSRSPRPVPRPSRAVTASRSGSPRRPVRPWCCSPVSPCRT